MKRIIFDANFLVDIARFKVDLGDIDKLIVKPYRLATLDSVVTELKKINSKHAKVALKLIEQRKCEIIKTGKKYSDEAIFYIARKDIGRTIVATNDAKLRKRIKALGVKTIYLRARKYLEIK